MKYNFYKLNGDAVFEFSSNILSIDIAEYLDRSETDLYNAWKKKYDEGTVHTGIAYSLNTSVLSKIKSINKEKSKYFIEATLFQHYNAFYGKLAKILLNDDIVEKRILLISQEESFRKKFNYDTSAITMDLIKHRTKKFFDKFEIRNIPEMYCIAFSDTPKIQTVRDFVTKNDKKQLILEWNE